MPVQFTADQESAVEYRRMDACVVAGPGSGKTTVLVERFRQLIEYHNLDVREILAITFTEKAAANMKAKLREKFLHDPLRLRELESSWVSTIHGFCARFLKENAIAAGIDPRFRVLDAREAEVLQFECMHGALDELVETRKETALALIAALQQPDMAGALRSAWDAIRSAGKSAAEVRTMAPPALTTVEWAVWRMRGILKRYPPAKELTQARIKQFEAMAEWVERLESSTGFAETMAIVREKFLHLGRVPASLHTELEAFKATLGEVESSLVDRHTADLRAAVFDVLERYEALYAERKAATGALDFNDLERYAIAALENSTVRDRVRGQFRQILLDEFQDINEQQAILIERIRGEDVFFAVGDVNQSIYGFRHARPEIFHTYRREIREAGKHSTELLHNFRSRPEILRCVEQLLNGEPGIEPRELVAGREFDDVPQGPVVEVLRVFHEDRDIGPDREAGWIAHRILGLVAEGTAGREYRHVAVLCRNGDSMGPILAAFDRAGIPYVCGRRESFVVSREGRDIAALLGTIANPQDWISKATVLRSRLVGLSDEGLVRARSGGAGAYTEADAERLGRFEAGLRRWRAAVGTVSLDVLIGRALTDSGLVWRPGSPEGENIEAFLRLARTRGANRSIEAFLHELKSIEGAASAEAELSDDDQGNRVQVMTTHAAKGLEFPVTIVAAMERGPQRSTAPVTFTPEVGLGLRWKDPNAEKPNTDGLKDSWALANSERLKTRERDEGNRLLYVAMTRAEELLILSYSRNDRAPQHWARMVEKCAYAWEVRDLDQDAPGLTAGAARFAEDAEVEVVRRPSLTSQHDSTVNVTSLTVFGNCPRKYYLQRYLGWQGGRRVRFDPEAWGADDMDSEDTGAADLGSTVHEALAGKPGNYSEAVTALADTFRHSGLGLRAAYAPRVEREWEFIAEIEGTLVRGSIDLWFEDPDGLVVVDYKTDLVTPSDVPERAAEYEAQLSLYALALEKALGQRPAWGVLHFLRPDVVWKVRLDDDKTGTARALVQGLREAQDWQEFEMNPGPKCQRCQYFKSLCPGGEGA
jgi:ATP-dependent exoDNAse (exonuclease V) beta subunit